MHRDEVIEVLQACGSELDEMGVSSLSLFGSIARNEQRATSDVDLLAEFSRPVSLFDVVRIQNRISQMLNGVSVDLVPIGCVPLRKLENIRRDLVHAYPQ